MDTKPNTKHNQEVLDLKRYVKEIEKAHKCGIVTGIATFKEWSRRDKIKST